MTGVKDEPEAMLRFALAADGSVIPDIRRKLPGRGVWTRLSVEAVRRAAQRFGYSHRDIVSGAGHDACYMARVAPTSMVFTPCVDGVSHNESEDIKQEWSTAGANVLMHAVLEKAEIVS